MRPTLIAGNWKMHKGSAEAAHDIAQLTTWLGSRPEVATAVADDDLQIVIAPPAVSLAAAAAAIADSGMRVYAQDSHWETAGAFTGEIAPGMLAEAGAYGVILGHSERRTLFADDDERVARKLAAALEAGLAPILCVGEQLAQRKAGTADAVVANQLRSALDGLSDRLTNAELAVAYEPIWAIGTGETATPEIAQTMHAHIRAQLKTVLGERLAAVTPILYGGSVKPDNVDALLAQPDIDGALVGGASLKMASFELLIAAGQRRVAAQTSVSGVQG